MPGNGGSGAGGRAGFEGSAVDFFLLFLKPMTSPKQEGEMNSIEPYRKKPHNWSHYVQQLFCYFRPTFQNQKCRS